MSSAEKQVTEFCGCADQREWLIERSIAPPTAREYDFETIRDWHRGGAETYILDFAVNGDSQEGTFSSRLIAKACVKMLATVTTEEWIRRRTALSNEGVATPTLHAMAKATILEEHIPYELGEAFARADEGTQFTLASEVVKLHETAYGLGFSPLVIGDLRSRGSDVVMIDFGEDLGGEGLGSKNRKVDGRRVILETLGKSALTIAREFS